MLVGFHLLLCLGAASEEKEDGGEEMAIFDESDCVSNVYVKLTLLFSHKYNEVYAQHNWRLGIEYTLQLV